MTSLIPKADFGTNTFKKTSVQEIMRTACPALANKLPKVNYKLIKNPALHLELENFNSTLLPLMDNSTMLPLMKVSPLLPLMDDCTGQPLMELSTGQPLTELSKLVVI